MAHDHHHHGGDAGPGRLVAAAGVNVGFAVVQVLVGVLIGSVVVLADATHQVVDAIGLSTAAVAAVLAARPSSGTRTFGWGKADALGSFVSALLLLASVTWIGIESVRRLLEGADEVDGGGVIAIGVVALAVNGASVLLVGRGEALALRAARLHLLTDLAGSGVVVVTGLLLAGTGADWLDPAASLLLVAVVVRATLGLLRRAADELLDRAPVGLPAEVVAETLRAEPEVIDVHHVHVRSLGGGDISVTAHVVLDGARSLHDAQDRVRAMTETLRARHHVVHATVQAECHDCDDATH